MLDDQLNVNETAMRIYTTEYTIFYTTWMSDLSYLHNVSK